MLQYVFFFILDDRLVWVDFRQSLHESILSHLDTIPIMQHMRCNLLGKGGVGDYTLKCEPNLAMVKTVQLKNVLKLFVVFLIVPLPEINHLCKYKAVDPGIY